MRRANDRKTPRSERDEERPRETELASRAGDAPLEEAVAKTGTTTIGIVTEAGVVMASDMRASLQGRFVLSKDVQKIEQIHPTAAVTLVGLIGGAQAYIRALQSEANLYEVRRGEPMSIGALHTLAGNLIRSGPYREINPILGGIDDSGHYVASIDPGGGVLTDDYVVTGSGMQLAYGVLEQQYEEGLSNDAASRIAAEGIQSAVSRDTGSGDGIYLAEVTDDGVAIHGHKTFQEVL